MRIGIDGRYLSSHYPGIGRYLFNLLTALPEVAGDEEIVVLHDPRVTSTRFPVHDLGLHYRLLVGLGRVLGAGVRPISGSAAQIPLTGGQGKAWQIPVGEASVLQPVAEPTKSRYSRLLVVPNSSEESGD